MPDPWTSIDVKDLPDALRRQGRGVFVVHCFRRDPVQQALGEGFTTYLPDRSVADRDEQPALQYVAQVLDLAGREEGVHVVFVRTLAVCRTLYASELDGLSGEYFVRCPDDGAVLARLGGDELLRAQRLYGYPAAGGFDPRTEGAALEPLLDEVVAYLTRGARASLLLATGAGAPSPLLLGSWWAMDRACFCDVTGMPFTRSLDPHPRNNRGLLYLLRRPTLLSYIVEQALGVAAGEPLAAPIGHGSAGGSGDRPLRSVFPSYLRMLGPSVAWLDEAIFMHQESMPGMAVGALPERFREELLRAAVTPLAEWVRRVEDAVGPRRAELEREFREAMQVKHYARIDAGYDAWRRDRRPDARKRDLPVVRAEYLLGEYPAFQDALVRLTAATA